MIASRRELVLTALVFALLAVAVSWPLPEVIGREIPVSGTPLDAMHLLYALTWSTQTLGDNPIHLFHATFFYPYSQPMAFLDHMVGLAALVAPVNWASGSMFWGYNIAWLLTFLLSGLGAYLLTRLFTRSHAAGLLAGVLYMLFPFRFHNAGQINVLAMMWIPFALLTLHLWIETRARRQLFLFLAFSLLQFLTTAYAGVFLFVAVLIYVAVLTAVDRRPTWELFSRQRWVILTVLLLGTLASLPFVTPYLKAGRADIGLHRSLGETALYSARPVDFITPFRGSLLAPLAPWARAARHPLFPGVVALSLLLLALAGRIWRGHSRRPEILFYWILTLVAAVLALGPVLGDPARRLPLPFAAAYYVVPGASFIRAPVRFVVLASLGIAVLAGLGLTRIRLPGSRTFLLRYGLVFLAVVELYPGQVKLLDPLPHGIPSVYSWLGSVQGPLAIVELPMPAEEASERIEHARYQLYSLVHKKRLVNGIAAYVPPITRTLRREMQHFPSNGSVSMLRDLGVNYALVHRDQLPPGTVDALARAVRASPGLNVVDMSGPIWILDVVPGGTPNLGASP